MNLIDRYITEVGKHLPRKNRMDIEAELRSTLEDMLEDRSQQTGRPADEALVAEILQEYGPPKKVAATYQSHPYLIGPRMFPTFLLVVKIVLFAVTLGLTLATVISLIGSNLTPPELVTRLGEFTVGLVSALVAAFGNVTLVFAILERVLPSPELDMEDKWTPAELTREPDPRLVKTGEILTSIVFTTAALIIFNFYPQIIGIWNNENGTWTQIAGLSEAFFRYMPWINLSGLMTIALDIWLFRQGLWRTTTRAAHIGLQAITLGIAAAMLRGPALLTFNPGAFDADIGNLLNGIFGAMVPVALIIVIVVNGIEIAKDTLRLLRPGKIAYPFEKEI